MTTPNQSGTNTPRDLSGNKKKFQNGWSEEQEVLLAKWSDYAACYRWLHDRTEKQLSFSNNWITIPVIIFSTITGSASVGLTGLVGDDLQAQKYGQISIGLVSLLTAIMTTLGNYFRFAQNSEAHRVAAVSWGKFNRMITAELAQKPNDRMDSLDFINFCKQDLDRLIEQSPQIPDNIIKQFEREFDKITDLKKPDICNGLEHTPIFNNSKTRMALMTAEVALNLKHKKKVLRDEILPDLNKMINSSVDTRLKNIEEQLRYENDKIKEEERKRLEELEKEKKKNFMGEVRKKLGEFSDVMNEFHLTVPVPISVSSLESLESSRTDKTHENVVIDIIGQKRD
uniref:SMODS and SLOG-associating 2TM effector domain-containing protein n=1 Tax=viral metagenome TaxID=1070528 RepID=A0A6C0IF01_9ZZZZ